jgi:hypothetical protein
MFYTDGCCSRFTTRQARSEKSLECSGNITFLNTLNFIFIVTVTLHSSILQCFDRNLPSSGPFTLSLSFFYIFNANLCKHFKLVVIFNCKTSDIIKYIKNINTQLSMLALTNAWIYVTVCVKISEDKAAGCLKGTPVRCSSELRLMSILSNADKLPPEQ